LLNALSQTIEQLFNPEGFPGDHSQYDAAERDQHILRLRKNAHTISQRKQTQRGGQSLANLQGNAVPGEQTDQPAKQNCGKIYDGSCHVITPAIQPGLAGSKGLKGD